MDLIRPLSLSFSVIQHTKIPAKTLCLIIIMTMTNNKNKNSNFKIKNIMIIYSKFLNSHLTLWTYGKKKKVCTTDYCIIQTYLVSIPYCWSFWLTLSCHDPALYPSAPVHALWRIIEIENRRWENHDPKRGSKRMLHHWCRRLTAGIISSRQFSLCIYLVLREDHS